MAIEINIYIGYFRDSAYSRQYQFYKGSGGNRNALKAPFLSEVLANSTVDEISTIYKSLYEINSINSSKYNKWLTVYRLLSLLLLLNSLFLLLFATSNRSL